MLSLPFLPRRADNLILGRTGPLSFFPAYAIPSRERVAHQWVIGVSGKGKSKYLENCIFQDISAGRGCGVIDPHALLIDDVLRFLITRGVLRKKVIREIIIYVDPGRRDYVIPFNILATNDEPYQVAACVLEAFRRTFPTLSQAPHFENLMTHALLVLIKTKRTLIDLTRLLTDSKWREDLLMDANEPKLTAFFHDRFDQWNKREAPLMLESSLNKITALSINPYLEAMLGQEENRLNLKEVMDSGKILLLNLGHLDTETNRFLGSLVMTSFELAMRRRQTNNLWPLTIDEFAQYMANEGSVTTLAHILSEARKFGLGLCISHQTLSQLTPRMIGAIGNTRTKVVFGVDRYDSEYLAKIVGRVDIEAVKRDPLTETQHELFIPLSEQWESWVDHLRFQKPRQATVTRGDGKVASIWTIPIAKYTATEQQVEEIRRESAARWGIPYAQAQAQENIKALSGYERRVPEPTKFEQL